MLSSPIVGTCYKGAELYLLSCFFVHYKSAVLMLLAQPFSHVLEYICSGKFQESTAIGPATHKPTKMNSIKSAQ